MIRIVVDEPRSVSIESGSVHARLRELIVSGEIAPLEHLSEPQLADRLGVSRTPVREALAALVSEGLAVRSASNRAVVAPVSLAEVRQIYELRARLEGLLARELAEDLSDETEAALRRHVDLMERLSDDPIEVARLALEFGRHIEAASGNTLCLQLLQIVSARLDRYRVRGMHRQGRIAQAVLEHRKVFEAIVSRDPDRAEAEMRRHIESAGASATAWLAEHASESLTSPP